MFLPWSPFVLNAFFLLLDFIVAVSFETTLVHISRNYEGYAQSIRWIQQAGIWEMITTLYFSKGMKLKVPWLALSATLLVGIAMTAIPIGAKSFVMESESKRYNFYELVSSRQIIVAGYLSSLAGWTFAVPYDTNVEEALASAIGSTRSVPHIKTKKQYHPRVSGYGMVCKSFDFNVHYNDFLVLPGDDCATLTLRVSNVNASDYSVHTTYGTKGRAKVVAPVWRDSERSQDASIFQDVTMLVNIKYSGFSCSASTATLAFLDIRYAGITSSPKTTLTKCLVPTGESIIISASVIRFMVPSNDMFHSVATSIFGTQDELVKSMQVSVDNTTLTTLPADLEELVIFEAKVDGTEATALVCVWSRMSNTEVPHIKCAYTTTTVLVIKPPPMNPDIARRLVNKGLNPTWTNITTTMVLNHVPRISKNTLSFNIPKIIHESAAAAHYFASLGNNFIVDWEGSMLYVIFDTIETVKGYEIPNWLFFLIIGATAMGSLFWIISWFLVDDRYWNSLYMVVSSELTEHIRDIGGTKPRLHQFNPNTLKFDGRHQLVAPKLSPQPSRASSLFHDLPPAGSHEHLIAF